MNPSRSNSHIPAILYLPGERSFENSAIYVVDGCNGGTAQRLQMLNNQLQAVKAGQDEQSAEPLRATAMRFNHDGTCLVAKVMNFKTDRVGDFAWSTLTGDQKFSADTERLGKSFDGDGEILPATRIVYRGNDEPSVSFFRIGAMHMPSVHWNGTPPHRRMALHCNHVNVGKT